MIFITIPPSIPPSTYPSSIPALPATPASSLLLLSLSPSQHLFFFFLSIFTGTLNVLPFAAFADMFPHKHVASGKLPFPIPPIPGWDQDTNPWDDYLYPPLSLRANDLTRHRGESVTLVWVESLNSFV